MRSDEDDAAPLAPRSGRRRASLLMRRAVLDLTPLRESREFRLLWLGELVSHTGRHITVVALPFQVFSLTHSPLAVGLIGLAQVVPLLLFSLIGGALADRVDRRRLLIWTQVGLVASGLMFVAGAIVDRPPVVALYLVAALQSALSAIDSPTRSAAIPTLVRRKDLASAIALNQLLFQVSDVAGPALGGIILARLGLAWAYGIDALTFLASIGTLLAMRPMPRAHVDPDAPKGMAAIREGFAYLKGRRVLWSTFVIDLDAMIFGWPRALFPVLAVETFHVGPAGLGLMYAAPGAGALLGALLTGWVRHVRRQGRAVLVAVSVWGLAIVGFGLSGPAFSLALAFLALAGAADVISAIFRSTILQGSIPDRIRGRISAIHIMVVTGGPRLGDLEAGVVAQLTTPFISVVSGGIACVVGVIALAAAIPAFARYRAGDPA